MRSIIRLLLQVTDHPALHRTRHCYCKRINIPTRIRRSSPWWESLRNNYALRLSSENWGALYAAIGSSVPRSGYHRDLFPFYYRIPHLDGWFLGLHRNEITLCTYQAQETPPVRYSSVR